MLTRYTSRRLFAWLWCFLIVLAAAPLALADRANEEKSPAGGRFLVEVGLALPQADLADDFLSTPLGAGAGSGLEIGLRWRSALSPTLALGPVFHFVNHRELIGGEAESPDYRLRATTLRYALELLYGRRDSYTRMRPFAGLAAGLSRNRLEGDGKSEGELLDDAVNTLSLALRAGVRWRGLEWSVVYNLNRFESVRFFSADGADSYNWDTVTVRMGWLIP